MRKLLLAAVALTALVTTANAAGYWRYSNEHDYRGRPACYAYTELSNGITMGLGINADDQELFTYLHKPSWDITPGHEFNIEVAVDDSASVSAPAFGSNRPHDIIIPVKQEYSKLFVHMVTAGHWLYIRFNSDEPNLSVSLWGSSDTYDKFERCAKRIAPEWAWRNRPHYEDRATQPYQLRPRPRATQPY
jgi:hypothetical protein